MRDAHWTRDEECYCANTETSSPMMRDSIIGKIILTLALLVFIYYVSWLILPFIQVEGDWIQSLFLPVEIAFMFPAIFGICFLGALSVFTLYHIREHVKIF